MNIGRKIFYEKATGNIIQDTGERQGSVVATTTDQDIATFTELSERNRETFDFIELPFGESSESFSSCLGYSVEPSTKQILFAYADPTLPEGKTPPQPSLENRMAAVEETLTALIGL